MEEKCTIKGLCVVLTRESLDKLKHKRDKNVKDDINEVAQKNGMEFSEGTLYMKRQKHNSKHFLQYSRQISNSHENRKLRHLDLPNNVDKVHDIVFKECVVILQKFDGNVLRHDSSIQKLGICENTISKLNLTPKSSKVESTLCGSHSEDETKKHLFTEKLPIYKQMIVDPSKRNSDLYEFDEPDSDKFIEVSKTRRKLKKRKITSKVGKKIQKTESKKPKIRNDYNMIVQEIVQKVLKKVNKGKLENKDSTLISKELHHKHNMGSTNEQSCIVPHSYRDDDNLSNVGIDKNTKIRTRIEENETVCENYAENNNTKHYLGSPLNPRNKINVISDVILNNTDSSFLFEDLEPNANSTVVFAEKCNPWRFNEHLKRNPHYLFIKKTALPCLQQDLVLDYNLVNKIEKGFGITPKNFENCTKKTIPPEVEYICDTNNKENIPRMSLFDNDNFTVIQENSFQDNFAVNRQKRKVLGPILQNNANISAPNVVPENNELQNLSSTRQEIFEPLEVVTLDRNLDKSISSNAEPPNLFEDEEPNHNFIENSKIYVPKVRKRRKLFENIEMPNQEKTKNEMTKTEQAELEQWATKFNSMCAEIENYKLEIE